MSSVGGSIEEVSIKGRRFAVTADADSNRKLGGFENEIQMNGDGTARTVKTRVGWQVDGLTLDVSDDRADQEFLQSIADRQGHVEMTVTYASGVTCSGKGTITGEVQFSSQSTTAPVTLGGGGKFTQQ